MMEENLHKVEKSITMKSPHWEGDLETFLLSGGGMIVLIFAGAIFIGLLVCFLNLFWWKYSKEDKRRSRRLRRKRKPYTLRDTLEDELTEILGE